MIYEIKRGKGEKKRCNFFQAKDIANHVEMLREIEAKNAMT
jgi:hypothetical protein